MAAPQGNWITISTPERKRREREAEEILYRYQMRIVKAQLTEKLAC